MWNYRSLDVWQRARKLAVDVYAVSDGWPRDERFGLTSQIRRAAVSVGSNIAEGSGRGSPGEYAQFLGYAIGSLNEVDHHLTIAGDLGLTVGDLNAEINEVGKMLHGLRITTVARAVRPNS